MTSQEKFDRYQLIKGLIIQVETYNKAISNNKTYSQQHKSELMQRNDTIIQGIIDRLLEK